MENYIVLENGDIKEISPKNNDSFTLKELQNYVGGYIEIFTINSDYYCVVNEMGVLDNSLHTNKKAKEIVSKLSLCSEGDMVDFYGNVCIIKNDLID